MGFGALLPLSDLFGELDLLLVLLLSNGMSELTALQRSTELE